MRVIHIKIKLIKAKSSVLR